MSQSESRDFESTEEGLRENGASLAVRASNLYEGLKNHDAIFKTVLLPFNHT
jgi:hypothetical protein